MGKRNKEEQNDRSCKIKKCSENVQHKIEEGVERKKVANINSTGNGQNKKTIYSNDEFDKMPSLENAPNTMKQNEKPKTQDNSNQAYIGLRNKRANSKKNAASVHNEEEPKDEDIDKFCDELDEHDNVEFENWVKLIEAKLHANKKKD